MSARASSIVTKTSFSEPVSGVASSRKTMSSSSIGSSPSDESELLAVVSWTT